MANINEVLRVASDAAGFCAGCRRGGCEIITGGLPAEMRLLRFLSTVEVLPD